MQYLSQEKLKIQELEISRQAAIISQQGEVISRLEADLTSMDRKYRPEVLKAGKNLLCVTMIYFFYLNLKKKFLNTKDTYCF